MNRQEGQQKKRGNLSLAFRPEQDGTTSPRTVSPTRGARGVSDDTAALVTGGGATGARATSRPQQSRGPSSERAITTTAAVGGAAAAFAGPGPARRRDPVAPSPGLPFDKVLEIIRKQSNAKALPLMVALLHMKDFYQAKVNQASPHCAELLDGIAWAMAEGRAIDGVDATTHLDHLAKKLDGGEDLLQDLRTHIIAEINNRSNANLIKPYVSNGAGMFTRSTRRKAAPVSAESIADELLRDINERSIKRYVKITRGYKPDTADKLFESIAETARIKEATHPGIAAFCKYIGDHRAEIALTEQNVQQLTSMALGRWSKSELRPKTNDKGEPENDENGTAKTVRTNFYAIPKGETFGKIATKVKWTKDGVEHRFKFQGDFVEVSVSNRRHLIDELFPKLLPTQMSNSDAAGASLAVFYDIVDVKKNA